MELNQAREIIGVQEDCTLRELDQKYDVLIRKHAQSAELDHIHQAYQVIYTHLLQVEDDTEKPFRKKIDNFLYHYKTYSILAILALVLIVSLSYSIINGQIEKRKEANRPPANIEIMIFGDYLDGDEELSLLDTRIKELFPDWESIDIELNYSPDPEREDSGMNMAAIQKSQVILATAKPDLYIFDARHYRMFVENGSFLPLDLIDEQITDELTREKYFKLFKQEEDDREVLYGIDLSDNALFKDLPMQDQDKIAVIRGDAKNSENSLAFLLKLLEK